jgi:hypothetical protein
MMEAVHTSETSVDNHFTLQYTPEDNFEHLITIWLVVSWVMMLYSLAGDYKEPAAYSKIPVPTYITQHHNLQYNNLPPYKACHNTQS